MRRKKLSTEEATTATPVRPERGDVRSIDGVEYIASSIQYPYWSADVALPQTIDDCERKSGALVYQKMHDTEPVLTATVNYIKTLVLSSGWSIAPRMDKPLGEGSEENEQLDWSNAQKGARYIEAVLKGLEKRSGSLMTRLRSLLDAIYMGHKLAELTRCDLTEGEFAGMAGLQSFTIKPRENYAYVVDTTTMAVRGITGKVPGGTAVIWAGLMGDASHFPWIMDPRKFVRFTLEERDGNPDGVSWFRSAYPTYREKQLMRAERLKYGVLVSGGSLFATAPPSTAGRTVPHPQTGVPVTVEAAIQAGLNAQGQGDRVCYPHGTEVTVRDATGNNTFFEAINDLCNREMVMAVLAAARSLLEAKHGSKADSEGASDVSEEIVAYVQATLCDAMERQCFYPLVADSMGEAFADAYTPRLVLGSPKQGDRATLASAFSQAGYMLDPGQFAEIDRLLGLKTERPRPELNVEVAGPVPASFQPDVSGLGRAGNATETATTSERTRSESDPGAVVDARRLQSVDPQRAAAAKGRKR